jgi:glycoside/pentoside/hexuronide:cation symporter, GPH family
MTTELNAARSSVSVATKILYGIGAIPFGVKDIGISYFLLLFYNQIVGLPASWVGLALMISLIFDGLVDPVIGHISDNWHSRWGRRHPFMYAASAMIGVAYYLLWNPPLHWSQPAQFGYLLMMAVIVRGVIAMYDVSNTSLTSEFTENYDQRSSLVGIQLLGAWGGGMIGGVTAYSYFLKPDAQHAVGQLNPAGYNYMGLGHGILMTLLMLICALGTHKHIPRLKKPPPKRPMKFPQFVGELRATLSNKSLLFVLASGLISSVAVGVGSGLNIYINTYLWELGADQITLMTLAAFAGAAISVSIVPSFGKRYGKKATAITAGLLYVIFNSSPLIFRLLGMFPANGSSEMLPILIILNVIQTAFLVSVVTMSGSMLADVVEDSEVSTGRRSEGVLFAAQMFTQKCVSGVGVFASGLILSAVQFPEKNNLAKVAPEVIYNLTLTLVIVHSLFYIIAMAVIAGYRITRAKHDDNLRILAERVAAAHGIEAAATRGPADHEK